MQREVVPILEMQGISRVYRSGLVETHALSGVDMRVEAGEFVAVSGPSGSGKSTLLAVAGLLETPDAGTCRLDGRDVLRLGDAARSAMRCTTIGFVFQGFNLIPELDVHNNVELPLRLAGKSRAERLLRTGEALERVGLAGRARHFPAQLSGGQQQRAAIARAIAGAPRLILADEPTGNLDSNTANGILDLFDELNATGSTLVVVTHDAMVAARATRQMHVVDGSLLELPVVPWTNRACAAGSA